MSELFWAVFDENQKKKTQEILATFEKSTKDELGLMKITIGLSDLMFPGTSVLHTRLRYIFLVGWIFKEAMKKNGYTIKDLHKYELQVRKNLSEAKQNNLDKDFGGIIGAESGDKELSQPAFSVYFNLLKKWEIITDSKISVLELDGSVFDREYLDIINSTFKTDTFILNKIEKEYILNKVPENSILETILKNDFELEDRFIDFDINKLSNQKQEELFQNAQYFSILMWGAMLYYDYFLGNDSDDLKDRFDEWKNSMSKIIQDKFDVNVIFEYIPNIDKMTIDFINSWYEYVKQNNLSLKNPPKINDIELQEFLKNREIALKEDRAKLKNPDKYKEEANSGLNPISYRWFNVKRFNNDLKDNNATNQNR